MTDDKDFTFEYLPHRGISAETMKFYGCLTKIDSTGRPVQVGFPYPTGATKVRRLGVDKRESFLTTGEETARKEPTLFGRDKFSAGSSQSITITEGQEDALSAFEMLGSRYPVVSVRSASTAKSDCIAERKFLDSFDKIYLCLDNDEHGQRAKAEIATLFDFNKLYDVQLDLKDANDYHQNNRAAEFRNIWHNARRFLPEGIISSYSEIADIIRQESAQSIATYPWPELNGMCDGLQDTKLILITAQEKIGKTEVIRTIEHHLLKTTDFNVGVIHLEEPKQRTVLGLAGLELRKPVHLSTNEVPKEVILDAYKLATRRDDRLHIYNHFGSDDPDVILDMVRFLATACSCKFIFLDHISMVVSGLMDDDERKALDYISTQLKMMTVNLGCTIFVISHVNDEGKPRGSRNIAKVCDVRIHLDRDIINPNPNIRNVTTLSVYLNRHTGLTGPAGKLWFDNTTFTLEELTKTVEFLPKKVSA